MKKLILYGAGGHCFAVVELIKSLCEFEPAAVYDDAPSSKDVLGVPVVKNTDGIPENMPLCISVGDNRARKIISRKFDRSYPAFIHEAATVYPSASVGKGTVIFPNSVVDAESNVGDFCIINNNATVSHHVRVSDFCHIAINAAIAGGVTIGEGSLIGAGSTILPNVSIGNWVIIGAGAVVTRDIPDYAIVMGQPAAITNYQKPS
jgi:sugar O-acyltransferase (sialic acid O-acetyltransferase NeuD family)